jgi:gentisate 1,2-dioxygenase
VTDLTARFVAADPSQSTANDIWEPVVIGAKQIAHEVERLLSLRVADPVERQVRIVHPKSCARGMGLAPGIEVRLSVLRPGEQTRPYRHNATEVGFCIEGEGRADVQGENRKFERYDVWNIPSWSSVRYENPSRNPVVWLTYSNAPVLRLLNVHLSENDKTTGIVKLEQGATSGHSDSGVKIRDLFQTPGDETWLMSYERLINPPAVESVSHSVPPIEVADFTSSTIR